MMRIPSRLAFCLMVAWAQPASAIGTVWSTAALEKLSADDADITPAPGNRASADALRRLGYLDIKLNPEYREPPKQWVLDEIHPDDYDNLPAGFLGPNRIGPGQLHRLRGAVRSEDVMLLELRGHSLLRNNYVIVFRRLAREEWLHVHSHVGRLSRDGEPASEYSLVGSGEDIWVQQQVSHGIGGIHIFIPALSLPAEGSGELVDLNCAHPSENGEWSLAIRYQEPFAHTLSGSTKLGRVVAFEIARMQAGRERKVIKHAVPELSWNNRDRDLVPVIAEGHDFWAVNGGDELCTGSLESIFPYVEQVLKPVGGKPYSTLSEMKTALRSAGLRLP